MDTSHLHLLYEAHTLVERAAVGGNSTDTSRPPAYKAVGLTLAVASGLLIGTSFVLKKTGLLRANAKYNEEAGEGYGYLKNAFWWGGMTLMILGEVCNFVAYAFVDAILVTPLGALSVVVTTILSAIFLKERLSFVGKIGCFNCIIGSIVIVMNAPEQSTVADIQEMRDYVAHPGFLAYAGVIIVGCLCVIIFVAPKYGKKSMLVYLTICSLIGGLSVVATQGLGSAIVAQAGGKPQFNQWFLYVLLVFVVATLLTEIIYLNKALNLFNAALVTPTYYVIFTTATIVTSAVLFRGFHGTPISIATIMMGFLQICSGVVLLQLSKSAKDVPDAAVFKGDLDQMREVAEQEQPETEPKADAIRGTAAIIRRISDARAKMEHKEFKRLHHEKEMDHLEPLKENEVVEWDGLRRRKTIVGDFSAPGTPIVRRKTIHPPLGMSHFPTEEEEMEERDRAQTHGGILESFRLRASSILHPLSPSSRPADRSHPQSPMHPVPLTDIQVHPAKSDTPVVPFNLNDDHQAHEHVYGLPAALRKGSPKPAPSPRSKPLPDEPLSTPTMASAGARRQFSFSNLLGRSPRATTPVGSSNDLPLPPSRGGLGSRQSSHTSEQKKIMKEASEEERLGLVKGDSYHALLEPSPTREPRTLQPVATRSRSDSRSSNSGNGDNGHEHDQYSHGFRSRSHVQSQARGRFDVRYARTRSSDSDGDGAMQIKEIPNETIKPIHPIPPLPTKSRNDPPPSFERMPDRLHQSAREQSYPPRSLQHQAPFQYTLPRASSNLPQGQESPSKRALHGQAEVGHQPPKVQGKAASNHSQSLSMSQHHIRTVEPDPFHQGRYPQDQHRSQGRDPLGNDRGSGNVMRREESPDEMQMTEIDVGGGASAASRKRFELQSQREREERRRRMSSGPNNPNI